MGAHALIHVQVGLLPAASLLLPYFWLSSLCPSSPSHLSPSFCPPPPPVIYPSAFLSPFFPRLFSPFFPPSLHHSLSPPPSLCISASRTLGGCVLKLPVELIEQTSVRASFIPLSVRLVHVLRGPQMGAVGRGGRTTDRLR